MKRYSIHHNDQAIEFEIIHRPAVTRRIHLEISQSGDLQVVAPRRMNRRSIRNALQSRSGSVAGFLQRARSRQQDLPEYRYISGEEHLFMGKRYPLEIRLRAGRGARVGLENGRICMEISDSERTLVRRHLQEWYRDQAGKHFTERLAGISREAPWAATSEIPMRLRRMKRTWGSCSSKGVITLNTHLVKAPPDCIDYVVAHEVCHLKEHNHGKAFYALQARLYPGWKEAKSRLRTQGHIFLHR